MGMYSEAIKERYREVYEKMIKKQAQEQSDHKQTMDMVNSPPHYNKTGIECIDAIKAMTDEGFECSCQGFAFHGYCKHSKAVLQKVERTTFDNFVRYL